MYVRTSDGGGGIVTSHYWFKDEQLTQKIEPRMRRLKMGLKSTGPEDKDLIDVG